MKYDVKLPFHKYGNNTIIYLKYFLYSLKYKIYIQSVFIYNLVNFSIHECGYNISVIWKYDYNNDV